MEKDVSGLYLSGHPLDQYLSLIHIYDALAPVFARNHKVVELNANSVNVRPGGEANMKRCV